ncbi:winged helix-turn-helix transcriptional regulator [Methanooceanicella nereidis]|nr:winged helix-turn-helix transcriptional regulator [Methanocella sp. CWC-04]
MSGTLDYVMDHILRDRSKDSVFVTEEDIKNNPAFQNASEMNMSQIDELLASEYGSQSSSGYIVMPAQLYDDLVDYPNLSDEERSRIDTGGADGTISYVELPLWIKIVFVIDSLKYYIAMFGIPVGFYAIKNLLDNRNRDIIYKFILENPGSTMADISDKTKINLGTVRYHLQKLESERKIAVSKIGKFTRFYKNSSTYTESEKIILSCIRNEKDVRIIKAIIDYPGMSNKELSDKLGLNKSIVFMHMRKLLNNDIIRMEQEGRNKKYYVNPEIKGFLQENMRAEKAIG